MKTVQKRKVSWKQPLALLLCFLLVTGCGWTGAFAENAAAPDIPEPPDSDLLADVESPEDWDLMFLDMEFSGDSAKDLLAVAETQIGYRESRTNVVAIYNEKTDTDELYGWTRYGAWYGEPYGEWGAMFVSFCLFYSGIPSDVFPYDSEPARWADTLTERGQFLEAGDYAPNPGDLMFTDWDGDGKIDHVGIVSEVNIEFDEVVTIEGDSNSGVDLYGYDATDSIIVGFATLPEKPAVEPDAKHTQLNKGTENAGADSIPAPPNSDILADVETSEDWDEMFSDLKLSGNWASDLADVAKSQLGYTESIRNFKATYNEERNAYDLYGWSRYGAWYGEPYGEWDAMFVSFCLFYAEVSSDTIPYDSDPARWADTLKGRGLFHEREDYTAQPGDLIFFDRDGDERAEHVGVVYEVNRESGAVNVIEGGRSGRVDSYGYVPDTGYILGYVALPDNPKEENTANPDQTPDQASGRTPGVQRERKTTQDDEEFVLVAGFAGHESGITIYIECGSGSVPPDTMMTLSPINGNMIKTLVNNAVDGTVLETRAIHVLLHDPQGGVVTPQKPVRFRLYPSSWNYTSDRLVVLQILDDNTVTEVASSNDFRAIANSGIPFEAQANGIYAIVNVA